MKREGMWWGLAVLLCLPVAFAGCGAVVSWASASEGATPFIAATLDDVVESTSRSSAPRHQRRVARRLSKRRRPDVQVLPARPRFIHRLANFLWHFGPPVWRGPPALSN